MLSYERPNHVHLTIFKEYQHCKNTYSLGVARISKTFGSVGGDKNSIVLRFHYDISICRIAFDMATMKIKESLESTPLPTSKRAPRLSMVREWIPDDDEQEKEDTILDSDDEEILTTYNEFLSNIAGKTSVVGCSPVEQRVHRNWEQMKPDIKANCVKKATEACHVVCEVIAPEAAEELFEAIHPPREEPLSGELVGMMTAYRDAPTRKLKLQILSLYAFSYSAKKLMHFHEPYERLTKWKIKRARAHAKKVGPGIPIENKKYHRIRIDTEKSDHFLEFINRPYFYQDVSFGTRKLKLDSGEQLTMPNVVRTVTRSTMIFQYLEFCKEQNFDPLSRSTLYRILDVREASQRKSLQGLDNIASDGAAGFESLENIIQELEKIGISKEWADTKKRFLREGKRYFKTNYVTHCQEAESTCADHCRNFALSDPIDKDLQKKCSHSHSSSCTSCENLKETLEDIRMVICTATNMYSKEQQEDLLYDYSNARVQVEQWKAHILRSQNQDKAKHDVVDGLENNSVFILCDWAMKFLTVKYREKQTDWFGKRGLNWHISSCILKRDSGMFDVISYAHLFDSCAQDWYAVLSILENLLNEIKRENPQITKAYLRSDEAGCYHNNFLVAALRDVGRKSGIKIERYDFSEPQHGKDLCDRIICPMKNSIRLYCNEGHDILTAMDMRKALMERPVRATTAAVCVLDKSKCTLEVNKLLNFSNYHNFSYEHTGLRAWKALNIGTGKFFAYDDIFNKDQDPTDLITEESFFPINQLRTFTPKSSKPEEHEENNLYECTEENCSFSFKTLDELEMHVAVDRHSKPNTDGEGFFDKLRRDWAGRFATIDKTGEVVTQSTPCSNNQDTETLPMGWALQKRVSTGKFPEGVKNYLTAIFDLGEATGRKADPMQVSVDMRMARDESGERIFTREDWLTKTQIKSFFSRLAAARRKRRLQQPSVSYDEDSETELDTLAEDVANAEQEKMHEEIMARLRDEIGLQHPIVFENFNICQYYREGKLKLFNIPMLKNICEYFEISFKARDKKAVFLKRLSDLVRECDCSSS